MIYHRILFRLRSKWLELGQQSFWTADISHENWYLGIQWIFQVLCAAKISPTIMIGKIIIKIKRILMRIRFGSILQTVIISIQNKWNSIFKDWWKRTSCYLISWERHLAGIVLLAHLWTPYLNTKKAAGQRIFILIQITVGFCLPLLIICGSYWSLTNVIAKHQDQISQSSDRKKPDMWKKNEQKVNTRVIIFVSACE